MENEKRLIDANEVERKLEIAISSWWCDCNSNAPVIAKAMTDALKRVKYAPTVDAVEVVHGRWLTWEEQFPGEKPRRSNYLGAFCDKCHKHADNCTDFCPNCGAKMDLKD